MTDDSEMNDADLETGETPASVSDVAVTQADAMDTTMAAGPSSGAAGVANAELGTSGPPAETILSPEELARVEEVGGAGLHKESLDKVRLD